MLIQLRDNTFYKAPASALFEATKEWRAISAVKESLWKFSGVTLGELGEEGLLIFPRDLDHRKDELRHSVVYTMTDKELDTGNIVGFLGWKEVKLSIQSRFDSDERQYFLHYMLKRVFGLHRLVDLKTSTQQESLWDFLPYLFPYCLKRALQQGHYRTYRTFHHNNDRLRGTIDVPAFIRKDIPARGRIAYTTREHTDNNPVFHLIRHTIEALRADPDFAPILDADPDTQRCVSIVKEITPDFSSGDLGKVLHQNARSVRHPYYTEYTALQKLCLQILQHEKLTYGEEDFEMHGILFDAAWLWEEYLNTLLKDIGFDHPENKHGTGGRYLYSDGKGVIYPDFLSPDNMLVLDAKYKRLDNALQREDLYQMATYLHVLAPNSREGVGLFIYPSRQETHLNVEGQLGGAGGTLGSIGLHIPSSVTDFSDFCTQIAEEEARFLQLAPFAPLVRRAHV